MLQNAARQASTLKADHTSLGVEGSATCRKVFDCYWPLFTSLTGLRGNITCGHLYYNFVFALEVSPFMYEKTSKIKTIASHTAFVEQPRFFLHSYETPRQVLPLGKHKNLKPSRPLQKHVPCIRVSCNPETLKDVRKGQLEP